MAGLSLRTRKHSPLAVLNIVQVDLKDDQQNHILCHCDTCKILGGGAFTMNQIIPKSALKITQGGEPAAYTYYGDSGELSGLIAILQDSC